MRQIFLKRQYSIHWANISTKILDTFNATTFLYQGPSLSIHATIIILIMRPKGGTRADWHVIRKKVNEVLKEE